MLCSGFHLSNILIVKERAIKRIIVGLVLGLVGLASYVWLMLGTVSPCGIFRVGLEENLKEALLEASGTKELGPGESIGTALVAWIGPSVIGLMVDRMKPIQCIKVMYRVYTRPDDEVLSREEIELLFPEFALLQTNEMRGDPLSPAIGRAEKAKPQAARVQIENLASALEMFKLDVGRYPTEEEGLDVLRQSPSGVKRWDGPYLRKRVPKDPWDRAYVYRRSGKSFEVLSYGADGATGGSDIDADILSSE